MYLLQLDTSDRDYLIEVLGKRRSPIAEHLKTTLKNSRDVFALAAWTDEDIIAELEAQGVESTPGNVAAVVTFLFDTRMEEVAVGFGWEMLQQAVGTLVIGASSPTPTDDPAPRKHRNVTRRIP